jgi:enamine deaminase RidA (YjgF/YER057c/UK114 family)
MSREILDIRGVHPSGTGYSHAARAGRTVYIAGQVSRDIEGRVVGKGDIEAQCRQVFANLRQVLAEAGGTFDDVVQFGTIVTDPAYVAPFRAIRAEFLPQPAPPNTLWIAGLVDPDLLVEVTAIAVIDG